MTKMSEKAVRNIDLRCKVLEYHLHNIHACSKILATAIDKAGLPLAVRQASTELCSRVANLDFMLGELEAQIDDALVAAGVSREDSRSHSHNDPEQCEMELGFPKQDQVR